MRNTINSAFVASTALAAFAAETETGAASPELPNAAQPVPSAETVAAITEAETADRKAKAAKLAAKRKAASADKPAKPAKASGKRGKPVSAKQATEAKPDARLAKAERVAAERIAIGALYAAFESNRVSVPVKTLSAFKPQSTTAHPIARQASTRQAAAIAVAFAAAGKKLAAGATAPRVFERNGVRHCIENGVLRDAVSSGLITVAGDSPETEILRIPAKADKIIIGLIGSKAANAGKLA